MNIRDRILKRCLVALTKREYAGVRICDANVNDSDDEAFCRHVAQALELIQGADPRRFRLVTKELRFIVNQELWGSCGRYLRGIHACSVDYGRYDFARDEQWYLAELARLIIHDATHGYLHSRGIPSSKANRLRVEHVCLVEENRFSQRLGGRFAANLEEFHPEWVEAHYRTPWWTRLFRLLKRIREEHKKAQSSRRNREAVK
ncbi:MAG: hypothetical protein HY343_08995 [Lentisphaerae bacterium]|nr:hypothetical protein [Lentisphaerota bacterium]